MKHTPQDTLFLLSKNLGCTGLEALGLHQKTKDFAAALIELRRYYSVENLNASWRVKDELEAFPRPMIGKSHTFLQKAALRRIRAKIKGDIKAMWGAVRDTKKVEQELFYALGIYKLPIHHSEYFTALLEAYHQSGEMQDASAVTEGREVFDTLSPKSSLIRAMGFALTPEETIRSEMHDNYYYRPRP